MKKNVLKKIIEEFQESELPVVIKRRAIDVNPDINKVITIVGPRRVGKTYYIFSLIKDLLEKGMKKSRIVYINFEDERLLPFTSQDFDAILEALYELYPEIRKERIYFFFDEIQEIPLWEKFVRRLYDARKARIVITGSSSKLTSREIATSLRGRALSYELFPFSFEETLRAKGLEINNRLMYSGKRFKVKKFLNEYLEFGGFPEVVLSKDRNTRLRILNEYLNTIMIRDLVERYNIRNVNALKTLIKFLVSNISRSFSLNSYYKMAKQQTPLTKRTLINFVSYLENINLFFFINKFSHSLKAQMVNRKKVYCIDVGYRTATGFYTSEDVGWRMENIVFLKLKQREVANPLIEIFYWRENKKQEVDFLLKEGQKLRQLIQVSYRIDEAQTRKREVEALTTAMGSLHLSEGLVITEDYEGYEKIKGKKIKFISLAKWLLEE